MTERISAKDFREKYIHQDNKKKAHKYKSVSVQTPDGKFDSIGEYNRWMQLKIQQKAGIISDLKRQIRIPLVGRNDNPVILESIVKKRKRQSVYIVDFMYFDEEKKRTIIEDFKGVDTKLSQLKRAIVSAMLDADVIITQRPKMEPKNGKSRKSYYRK
jgi:Protein of unknown function (DUF1064)